MSNHITRHTIVMLKAKISVATKFINLEGFVRQVEILFVAGFLYYIFQRTSNLFSLILFIAIMSLDFLNMLHNALDGIDDSDDDIHLYASIFLQIFIFVVGVIISVTIAVDFAALQE